MSPNSSSPATVADVLGPYLIAQCETALSTSTAIAAALESESSDPGDQITEEQVHQARVAYRRIRSVLRIFPDFFSVPEAGRISDDASWLAQRLGAVRDLDVLAVRLRTAIEDLDDDLVLHDPLEELDRQLRSRREIALSDLRDAMHTETFADLVDQLRSWQHGPPWSPDADKSATKIKKYVKAADQRLGKRLTRAAAAIRTQDPDADELTHAARKSAKRYRYAVEAAQDILGLAADKIIENRKDLQDLLGEYQDSVLASGFLRDLGGIPGRNGFTFGVLHRAEADNRRRLRKQIGKRAR